MMFAVVAGKGAPGATTVAGCLTAVAADRGDPVLLAEFDVAGGSLALEAQLPLDPGLQSLAAAARHGLDPALVDAHSQSLGNGARVLLAPTSPVLARSAVGALAPGLAAHFASRGGTTVVDVGRWDGDDRVAPVLAAATAVFVVLKPTVVGTEHSRTRLDPLRHVNDHVRIVCVGDDPYPPGEVAAALAVPCEPAIARDERAAALIRSGVSLDRWLRRTSLVRSAAALLDRLGNSKPAEATA